ncbi:MAG: TetR family transcriptional regulator [Paraclostridium sp.]|uniref:TetR family transcriptional regulator n=1 Tax=Paraclostridium sp. TaxID=2023273 RepID=UPI003EE6DCC7
MSQITKKALASSLKSLMNTTSLNKITINDIVQDCGVNRRTFYYHFKDIYLY